MDFRGWLGLVEVAFGLVILLSGIGLERSSWFAIGAGFLFVGGLTFLTH